MCTISLSLAKPWKAMLGPYSSLMVLRRRASRSGAGRAVRGRNQNRGTKRRRRSDSTFYFKQRQSHAPQRGACDCQERIRQLVVFTPGSCPRDNLATTCADFRLQQYIHKKETLVLLLLLNDSR